MKIIVTGASGMIGSRLVRDRIEAGDEVEAWTRSAETTAPTLPARCQVRHWDPTEVDPQSLAGADAIVHLAGESVVGGRWSPARKKALETSRIDSSRAIIRAIAALPPQRRPKTLLSASAIGFYGNRADEPLSETSGPGQGFMPNLCRAWEETCAEAKQYGVRWVALRIGLVLAPEGGLLGNILPLFRAGLGGRIGSGKQWMSWIHVDDVVGLLGYALTHKEMQGAVNGSAPHPVRNTEFTRALGRELHRPALIPVPAFALNLALGEMSEIMMGSQKLVPKVAADSGFSFRYPELAPALAEVCAHDAHELLFEQKIDAPVEKAFSFFADASNLEKITPPFLNFSITRAPEGLLAQGAHIEYKLRLHGLPVRWRTRIDQWEPPHRFVDLQERGPYALWHHTPRIGTPGRRHPRS